MATAEEQQLFAKYSKACDDRSKALDTYGQHSNEWLRADIEVKRCQRQLRMALNKPKLSYPLTLVNDGGLMVEEEEPPTVRRPGLVQNG